MLPFSLADVVMVILTDITAVILCAASEAFWESWGLTIIAPGDGTLPALEQHLPGTVSCTVQTCLITQETTRKERHDILKLILHGNQHWVFLAVMYS